MAMTNIIDEIAWMQMMQQASPEAFQGGNDLGQIWTNIKQIPGQAIGVGNNLLGQLNNQTMPWAPVLDQQITQAGQGIDQALGGIPGMVLEKAEEIANYPGADYLIPQMGVMRALPSIKKGAAELPVWGKEAAQEMGFQYRPIENQFLRENISPTSLSVGEAALKNPANKNSAARELSGAYNAGVVDLPQARQLFQKYLVRDPEGMSIFDRIWEDSVQARQKLFENPNKVPYKPQDVSVSNLRTNMKLDESGIIPLDTSRGCLGFCPECYGLTGTNPMLPMPIEQEFKSIFSKNPDAIRRIGEYGDPSINPISFREIRPEFEKIIRSGKSFSPEELDAVINPAFNWNWTNEQIKNSGLGTAGYWYNGKYIPGGRDKTFFISKLQSIEGFDPNLVRNIEVSVDPGTPSHFFRTLENAQKLKEMDPSINMALRVRSVATANDEMNALQKMVVDFANKNNIPVLETRLRFKSGERGLENFQTLPEYYWDAQMKHSSYYPSVKAKGSNIENNSIKSMEYHTPDGPVSTDVYAVKMGKEGKDTIWDVYKGDELIKQGYKETGKNPVSSFMEPLVSTGPEAGQPSKIAVRDVSVGQSPLSEMGLRPDLHQQCGVFNATCKECQGCQTFTKMGESRAKQLAKDDAAQRMEQVGAAQQPFSVQ